MACFARFNKDDYILCYYAPLLYQAKIMEVDINGSTARYKVHYVGWRKNWDEWACESRIVTFNDVRNQQAKEELKKIYTKRSKMNQCKRKIKHKVDSQIKTESINEEIYEEITNETSIEKNENEANIEVTDAQQRKPVTRYSARMKKKIVLVNDETEQNSQMKEHSSRGKIARKKFSSTTAQSAIEETVVTKNPKSAAHKRSSSSVNQKKNKKLKIPVQEAPVNLQQNRQFLEVKAQNTFIFPRSLLDWINFDWRQINNDKKLHIIPARTTVMSIITEYKKKIIEENKLKKSSQRCKDVIKFCQNMLQEFNADLESKILYEFEKRQYKKIKDNNTADVLNSMLYGITHLLRMLSSEDCYKLVEKKKLNLEEIHRFLAYIEGNYSQSTEFYEVSSWDYRQKV